MRLTIRVLCNKLWFQYKVNHFKAPKECINLNLLRKSKSTKNANGQTVECLRLPNQSQFATSSPPPVIIFLYGVLVKLQAVKSLVFRYWSNCRLRCCIIQVNTHTIRYRTFFLQSHTIRIVTNSTSTKAFFLKYEAFVEVTTILFVARAKVKVAHMRE